MRLRFNLEHYLRIRNLSTRVEIILQTCTIPVYSFIEELKRTYKFFLSIFRESEGKLRQVFQVAGKVL